MTCNLVELSSTIHSHTSGVRQKSKLFSCIVIEPSGKMGRKMSEKNQSKNHLKCLNVCRNYH